MNANMIAFNQDNLTRSIDLARHCFGEFSMANVQANTVMEDQSNVEVAARNALFLGVYDGHGGANASLYVLNNLFGNLLRFAHENDNTAITAENLRNAVLETERGFLEYVEANIDQIQQIGKIGSCCLAGVVWKDKLYVANLGDSRAVIGSVTNRGIETTQLTTDHNCNNQVVRQELHALHPDDPTIVMERNGAWRVKGIIMVSRSIGDAYLKSPDFPQQYEPPVPPPFTRGVLSAEPQIVTRTIADTDKFVIFASDGLWELMSNEVAGQIVHSSPRHGIAKRLLSHALEEAARRYNLSYSEMQTFPTGRENLGRRTFHDDISVIVIFLDKKTIFRKSVENRSYRGSHAQTLPSDFTGSKLLDSKFKGLKDRIKKQFKGSSSKGQSSRGPEGVEFLDMGMADRSKKQTDRDEEAENEGDQSSRVKSRWDKLKNKFTPKKLTPKKLSIKME
ncbi:Protein phosphatase 2C family protein [Trifolium repens]|nr:Protein phosphatase 2C family protein [Trifolium repens]